MQHAAVATATGGHNGGHIAQGQRPDERPIDAGDYREGLSAEPFGVGLILWQHAVGTADGHDDLQRPPAAAHAGHAGGGHDGHELFHPGGLLAVAQPRDGERQQPVEVSHDQRAAVVELHRGRGANEGQPVEVLVGHVVVGIADEVAQIAHFQGVTLVLEAGQAFLGSDGLHRHSVLLVGFDQC